MSELSFADAVKLIDTEKSGIVQAIDRITGGAILATAALGFPQALALLGAKNEFAQLCGRLVAKAMRNASGATRRRRTEQLEAAHSAIVIGAYFQALSSAKTGLLNLDRADQLDLAYLDQPRLGNQESFVEQLLRSPAPTLAPHRTQDTVLEELGNYYARLSLNVYQLIADSGLFEAASSEAVTSFRREVSDEIPASAVLNYQSSLVELAGRFPEFRFWVRRLDQAGSDARLSSLETALMGLENKLIEIAAQSQIDALREGLARSYRAALSRPIIDSDDVPDQLTIPTLEQTYINPNFRVAEIDRGAYPARESWWEVHPKRSDLESYLLGYLTSAHATRTPLIVLGQPGSGKSLLTRLIAAKLPAPDFLVVRVPLRDVASDANVQTQIESGISLLTGDSISWPTLSRSAAGALPIVLLDGFDEFIQATQVSQSDYLEKVSWFQRREAEQGRPLLIVVTSRTSVADRAVAPSGAVVLKLEPFDSAQTARWLDVWNLANSEYFATNGLHPLPVEKALEQGDLAGQPLLLLMLALYDAEGNKLQDRSVEFKKSELYEALLRRFSSREARRQRRVGSPVEFQNMVEEELDKLAFVAFSMFNRGKQWVSESELHEDFSSVGDSRLERLRHAQVGDRPPLTEAGAALGRFFFIEDAKAMYAGRPVETYEFLHSTFSEYLVARYTWKLLTEALRGGLPSASDRFSSASGVDYKLRRMLSFSALSARTQVLSFLDEITTVNGHDKNHVAAVIFEVIAQLAHRRESLMDDEYEPQLVPIWRRYAVYSANLLILLAAVCKEIEISGHIRKLQQNVVAWWAGMAALWRGHLSAEEYRNLCDYFAMQRQLLANGDTSILITKQAVDNRFSDANFAGAIERPGATREYPGPRLHYRSGDSELAVRMAAFECDLDTDLREHALDPIRGFAPAYMEAFYQDGEDGPYYSAAHAITSLVFSIIAHADYLTRIRAYQAAAKFAGTGLSKEYFHPVGDILARLLSSDEVVSPGDALDILTQIAGTSEPSGMLVRAILPFLGRDETQDQAFLDLMNDHLNREVPGTSTSDILLLEAWVTVAERGLMGMTDPKWSEGPRAAFPGFDVGAVEAMRPDVARRYWLFEDQYERDR